MMECIWNCPIVLRLRLRTRHYSGSGLHSGRRQVAYLSSLMRDCRNRRDRCGSMSCGHSMGPSTQIRRTTRSCMPSDPNYLVRRHAEEMRRQHSLRICVDLNGKCFNFAVPCRAATSALNCPGWPVRATGSPLRALRPYAALATWLRRDGPPAHASALPHYVRREACRIE